MSVERATAADAEALRRAAASAFRHDDGFKPPGAVTGGPPGHACLDTHRRWIREWKYFKGSLGIRIMGGCIIKPRGAVLEVFGLFLHEKYIGRGVGRQLLTAVMDRHPPDAAWILETPDYASGSHLFYEGCGFRLQHRTPADPHLGFGFYNYRR